MLNSHYNSNDIKKKTLKKYAANHDIKKKTLKKYAANHISKGWLVGCFGFNGPLRQYFSLCRAVSQREGEREEKR